MGTKLSIKDNELYKITDEILHYIWDPIGVAKEPYARDEYYGYLPQVFNMLLKNDTKEIMVNYLLSIEEENMGLTPNKKKAENVIDILKTYKLKIDEKHT